jgi:predicted nucleic acid-binding protein
VNRRVFFDTNIVVYLYTLEQAKSERALELVSEGGIVSVQVLNEFISVARKKLKLGWSDIEAGLSAIRAECDILPLDIAIHQQALELCQETNLSIYDGLIVAAALTAGCDTLYSEDMNHGQRIGSLHIINPFRLA